MSMTRSDLIKAMKRLKVETGSFACFGCGCEHNCGVHGCAILREAISTIQQQRRDGWLSVADGMPEAFAPVIICRPDKQKKPIVEVGCKDVGDWWRVYGTRTKSVTHWMPLPEPPEEKR